MEPHQACALLAGLWLFACAPTFPATYQRACAAAQRAYASGRYAEAARYWLAAAREAEAPRDRGEAEYRAAASLERAGRTEEAARQYDAIARDPKQERAARAAFARAQLEIRSGNAALGYRRLERALRDHPDSGLAPAALHRILRHVEDQGGLEAVLARLRVLIAALDRTELAETLHYAYAVTLERSGQLRPARDRYLYVATRFPYPSGALWDDSLWHASELEEKLGDYRAAIRHLERMLAERETSSFPGSSQRPRFDDARLRIGLLYRDRLGDLGAARREFWKLYTDHPDSVLRDDALWDAALTARAEGDPDGTCDTLRHLVREFQDSRYAPCAVSLCPGLSSPGKRSCHAYLRREIDAAPAVHPVDDARD
jgi:tetratricopeptide (TPR) repeat protein